MLGYFVQGVGFGFAAAVQPGPFQTYLISQSIRSGFRKTLPAIFAPLLSDGPIIALVLIVLVHVPDTVIQVLRLAGGAFVLFLAWEAWRAWRAVQTEFPSRPAEEKSFLRAAFVNLLSPGPYLFWSLVGGPLLLTAWREAPSHSLGLLLGFYLVLIGTMGAIVLLISSSGRLGPGFKRAVLLVSALALAGLGIYQITLGLLGLLR